MGPVMTLLVFNLVMFVVVVVVLVKHSRKRIRATTDKSVKATIQTLISITGIVSVFGLTWLFGAFTVTQNSQLPFLILFVVFSSFQGFFVFLFFCVFNRDARQAWIQFLTHGKHGKRKTLYLQKTVNLRKPATSHATLSTTSKRSSQHYSTFDTNRSIPFSVPTQESIPLNTEEYDMQEMQIQMDKELYLNEGAFDTDISQAVHPAPLVHGVKNITCSAAEGHVVSNPGAH